MQKEQTGLRKPNSGKICRKVGRADCGNDFFKQALAIVQTAT